MANEGGLESSSLDVHSSSFANPSSGSSISSPDTPNTPSLNIPSSLDVALVDRATTCDKQAVKLGATSGKVYYDVWKHYIKEKVGGKDKARCKYCNKLLLLSDLKQGTSHLKKHLKRCT